MTSSSAERSDAVTQQRSFHRSLSLIHVADVYRQPYCTRPHILCPILTLIIQVIQGTPAIWPEGVSNVRDKQTLHFQIYILIGDNFAIHYACFASEAFPRRNGEVGR